jgi:WD40 repeat protein
LLKSRAQEIAFHPGGSVLAFATEEGTIKLWDLKVDKEIASLRDEKIKSTKGDSYILSRIAFSPDGLHLAVLNTNGSLKIWDCPQIPGEAAKR